MTELRKKMRRSLAGILAFCVIFTSIPGIAWADELPEFDEEVLTREEVMASAELKLIPEDTPIPYSELTEKAQNAIRTTEPVTLSQLGQISTGKDREYYSDLFSGDVFRAGQYGDPDTTCVAVFVKPVEKLENYSEYTITGSEKYVFLYVNKTEQDYNMKINIAGYNAKIVTVPSANTVSLLNKKKASPSNSEAVSVNGGGSAVTEGGIKNEELTGEETAAEETTTAEDTSIEDSSEGEITKETEEETVSSTEPESAEETSGPEETPAHESADETKGADETVSVDETVAETAAPETDSVDNETGSVEPTDSEPIEIRSESSDNGVESELDIVASLSRSPHTAPIVGVPVAGEVYEGEAKSPEEEYNLMRGLPADYEEDEDEEDVYAYTDDSAQEDQIADYSAAVMILTGLLEKEETASPSVATRSSIPRSFYRRSSEVVAVGASEEIIETVAESSGGTFRVSFYDYAFNKENPKSSPNEQILELLGKNDEGLLIGALDEKYGKQNRWIWNVIGQGYGSANGRDKIVMQGLAKDTYDSEGRIQFNYTTGPIFGKSGAGTNPDMTGIDRYEEVKVIEGDDSNEFFQYDKEGNFEFDSNARNASLKKVRDTSGNVTYTLSSTSYNNSSENKGFWPLNGYNKNNPDYDRTYKNEFFGMTLSFDFLLPDNGKITTTDGEEKNMVFEFTGDDDVWVYIKKAGSNEGRLALDLGGIHGASGGKIDFSTGVITHDDVWTGKMGPSSKSTVYWYLYEDGTTTDDIVDDKKISKVVGLPKIDWGEYTLDFYYMERGGEQSNCKIKANMPTIPKDKVAVYKSVAGDTEEKEFTMTLQIKDEGGSWEDVETTTVGKNKIVQFTKELPKNTEYRVVEGDTSAPVTSWKIGDEIKDGLTSPTGIVGTNNLAICFNNYDFAPSISKKAVREEEEQDLYWISLGITGNSAVQQAIDGTAQPFYIEEVDVIDVLTKEVNFELSENVPQIKLKLKKSGESNFTELAVQVEKTAEGKYRIVYKGQEIATFEDKTIKWNAVMPSYDFGNFDEYSTVELSYLVRVDESAEYKEDVSEYRDLADSDTGTHSKEKGYYSNKEATAGYKTSLVPNSKRLIFKKPVVRPLKPEGSLTITKEVDSELTEAAGKTFDFIVELSNIKVKNFKAGMSGDLQTKTANTDGSASLSFRLKDGESYEITGLNKETTYKVVEGLYSDIRFYSNLKNISVTKNGLADGSGVNVSNRSAEGTLTDTAGSRTEYYYKTASGVNGDELYYGSEENIAEIKGEDGWYDNGTLIPEDDERFYKTETGSVLQEVNAGAGVYTWSYGYNSVSADADNMSAIKTAQNKALGWLSADGYKEEPVAEKETPYKVSARKVERTWDEDFVQFRYGFWNSWEWENENPEKKYAGLGYTVISKNYGDEDGIWPTKQMVTYTYQKLSTPLVIIPTLKTSPAGHYWTWNGVKYDSQDALISALTADGWQAEKDGTAVHYYRNVKLTNSELLDKGYEHRLYSERTVTVPASNKALAVSAVFTNSFEKRESITVQKMIQSEEGRDVANETYSYQVERYDGENVYQQFNDYTIEAEAGTTASHDSENGIFTITGAGSVELIIDETIKKGLFRIKETDRGTADEVKWTDSDSEYSKLLQNGDTAVCTNYYYNNTLTIAKMLSADSYEAAPEESKIFTFTVALTDKNGTPLSQVGYQTADGVSFGSDVDTNNHVISLTNGEFTFMMKAGGRLVLEKIPSKAQYTVTEKSFSDERYVNYYTVELVSTKKNEEAPQVSTQDNPVSKTVSGNFSENGSTAAIRDQKVEYTNKITPIRRDITVNKLITDKNGNPVTNDGDGETFIFEITNTDVMSPGYGEKFYASVITNGGSGSMTIHNVFAGVYSVEEMKHMRFKPVAAQTMAEINAVKESGAVEFKNYRSSSEYFSDSKAAINKVDEKGFTRTSSEDSGKSSIKPVELPPAMLKHDEILFGEGSFDSEDIPYYG